MRALEKLQIDAAAKSFGEPPELKWIDLAHLVVDERYQRDTGAAGRTAIRKIAARFSWSKFSPVIVHMVEPANYAIIDGQHRCTAALSIGIKRVPCSVVSLKSAADAAEVFAAVNGDVIRMNVMALFKAARAAGVPWAVDVQAACDAVGIKPLTHPTPAQVQKPAETNAIGRLRRIAERHGRQCLEAVLRVVMSHPLAQVPGYINSKVVDQTFTDLSSDPNFRSVPYAVALARMAVVAPATTRPANDLQIVKGTGNALVTVAADKRREAFDRIQELKSRGCNRSMVAAITKFRMSLINEFWEGFTDAKA